MIIMEEEEVIEEIINKIRMLGFKNASIETAGYLRLEDISSLYKHKLEEYSSPIYFRDERLELKKAYVFLKSFFDNSNIIEMGNLFSPEYRTNLQVEVMKAIRDSERVEKEAIEEKTKEDAIEYNKKLEKINAEKYVARRNYYTNKTKIERKLKKLKKGKNKHN
jgi:hypothetical protein